MTKIEFTEIELRALRDAVSKRLEDFRYGEPREGMEQQFKEDFEGCATAGDKIAEAQLVK
jgi:hypothetical protein